MAIRFQPQGAMSQAPNGPYVAASDYDALAGALERVLSTASTYFEQIETGDLSAKDAEAALTVCATLAQC